jgi:hypothetical protein
MANAIKARARGTATRCSFCRKADEDVKLSAGPGVYVCDGCVQLCNEILQRSSSGRPAALPWRDTLSDEEMLHQLGRVAAASAQVARASKSGWTHCGVGASPWRELALRSG